jgi:hypothetical protein
MESGTGYLFSSFHSESCTNLFWGGEMFPSLFHLPIIPLGAASVPGLRLIYYKLTYNSKTNETKKEKKEKEGKQKKIENQAINMDRWWTKKE